MRRYTEMELSSAELDQEPCPVKKKVFILMSGRTGSFMLCRSMINYGLGVPHEYFQPVHIPILGARWGLPELSNPELVQSDGVLRQAYIDALMRHRTANGVFAAKIGAWQYETYLNNPEGDRLLSDSYLVYLYREDLLSQAVSTHFAVCSDKWGFDDTVSVQCGAMGRAYFDPDWIDQELAVQARENMNWKIFFARHDLKPVSISLEALQADVNGFLDRIANDIGIKPVISIPDYAEPAYPDVGLGMPSKKEARRLYLQAKKRIR